MSSNKAPYVSLELDEDETKWLHGLLSRAHAAANSAFRDVCQMPSSDPRSNFRAMLQMAANVDQITSEQLAGRIQRQAGDLVSYWNADRENEQT